MSRINSIEIIDLKSDSAANRFAVSPLDIMDMSAMNVFSSSNTTAISGPALGSVVAKHQLMVFGSTADTIFLGIDNWTDGGTNVSYAGHTLHVYDNSTVARQLLFNRA